jgi:hypothetical protein
VPHAEKSAFMAFREKRVRPQIEFVEIIENAEPAGFSLPKRDRA